MNKWTKRYLQIAEDVSSWSKDPSTKIGAVCVGHKGQLLSQGYNGFPRGIKDSSDRLQDREEKYKYVVHAELNCIFNAAINGVSLDRSTMYLYGLPTCTECAKGIIQVGISRVIIQQPREGLERWEESTDKAISMLKEAGVRVMRYDFEYELID